MKLKNQIFTVNTIKENWKEKWIWFIPSLSALMKKDLPISLSYKLIKFNAELTEKEIVYNEARLWIFKKYWEEEWQIWQIKSEENIKLANKEFAELLALEEEYSIEPIVLPEDIKIPTIDLIFIKDILNLWK